MLCASNQNSGVKEDSVSFETESTGMSTVRSTCLPASKSFANSIAFTTCAFGCCADVWPNMSSFLMKSTASLEPSTDTKKKSERLAAFAAR